jgi:hypothetical protein
MYSTLAGILCGFAFTAIVLLLVTQLADAPRAHRVLAACGRALVSAFFGLLIMCVLYAAEASSALSGGQAISENAILSDGFVGVGILLIYAIVLMLDAADETDEEPRSHAARKRDVALFARTVACGLTLLMLGMVYEAVGDYQSIRYGVSHSATGLDVLAWTVLGVQLVVSLGSGWLIGRQRVPGHFTHNEAMTSRSVVRIGLALPFAAAAAYVAFDTATSETDTIAPVLAGVVLLVAFACTCGTTLHLALTRPAPVVASASAPRAAAMTEVRLGDGEALTLPRQLPSPEGRPRRRPEPPAAAGAARQRAHRIAVGGGALVILAQLIRAASATRKRRRER